jgi:23S rRNA pseudouridine1911/1915/1917 synthase
MEKAYKLLAIQEHISNKAAKELIDKGLVYVNGRQVKIARGELPKNTKFSVKKINKAKIIYEDKDILALDKPAFIESYELEKQFGAKLLNRLDKQTSGVIILAKNEKFRLNAINEFKKNNVYKEYSAIVEGKLVEELECDLPILTIKKHFARSKIDLIKGKPAYTKVIPDMIVGNKSKVKIIIKYGRTHQIRVHLKYLKYPIIGDEIYGIKSNKVNRMLLHSRVLKIFDYEFRASEPSEYKAFGF